MFVCAASVTVIFAIGSWVIPTVTVTDVLPVAISGSSSLLGVLPVLVTKWMLKSSSCRVTVCVVCEPSVHPDGRLFEPISSVTVSLPSLSESSRLVSLIVPLACLALIVTLSGRFS